MPRTNAVAKAWFRSAPVGRLDTRAPSPLSISTTSSVYPSSSRSCSPASRPVSRSGTRPNTRPNTRPSSPAYASTPCTPGQTPADHYKAYPADQKHYYAEPESYRHDHCDPSPVTPTVRSFISRERTRIQSSLLALRELWTVHSEGASKRAGNRRTVTHEYVELSLDVIDRWDEGLGWLVEALVQAEEDWYFAQDLVPGYGLEETVVGHGGKPGRKLGYKELAAEAVDAYLELRFETAEQLDELEATWRSMMRLV
ncbi:hypothetical protein A1Q1_06689 [Trichosporon asahii var. asahii CBS 2479]|uniref:Uncharacterized protein n=1 Tax=Trichosporon asahii var. asahii (strain ATCC 90039 / CBS 2479 / JCM 2466 / KCTC 7840 / NBRC 103889/ NCYC 2677 / UAMH 7654) TaxID=1186058 RepID=J6F4X5_TRIAS|nr:hypothetical protein A1Q1_06689 [Trichosporon asahii var. asahii CBS 2479]EJT52059.1 hypothetical protein A1Q1_06689 [Trichosporon asahii var. asahii CBS 2479]